jgi:hypothetical protein
MWRVFHLTWVILLLALAPAYTEIYKWVDSNNGPAKNQAAIAPYVLSSS